MFSRRQFNHSLIAASVSSLSLPTWAFTEGKEYIRLPKAIPTQVDAGQFEVLEFFAYSCVHCYRFEPILAEWKKTLSANVVVRQVQVQFSPAFEPLAKTFYAFEALGWLDTLHQRLFAAIHLEKKRIYDEAAIMQWISQQGVDTKAFQKAYASFGVAGKTKRAVQLSNAYAVEGTPSLGIHGQFMVPGQGDKTIQVANELLKKL